MKLLVVSIPYLLIGSALCVFGTLGNLSVLGAVAVHRALQNSRSVFLVNLAIADLIVTSIADPFTVVGKFFLDHKYQNNLTVEAWTREKRRLVNNISFNMFWKHYGI